MKTANLGEYLLWEDKPAKVVGEIDRPCIIVEMLDAPVCPHCESVLEKHQFTVIPTSPLFQENAKPFPTIKDITEQVKPSSENSIIGNLINAIKVIHPGFSFTMRRTPKETWVYEFNGMENKGESGYFSQKLIYQDDIAPLSKMIQRCLIEYLNDITK